MFIFCKEAMIPAVDLDGKIIMESTYQIATSNVQTPASVFEAICNNEKVREAIGEAQYVQVCNITDVLCPIFDPV